MKDKEKSGVRYKAPELHLRFQTQELYLGFLELVEKLNQRSKRKMSHNALLNAMVAKALYPTEEESFQDRWGLFLSQKRNH